MTDPGHWYLFNEKNRRTTHETHSIAGKEFDLFLDTMKGFLERQKLDIKDIDTIYLVTGPASFTGGRIMTLTLGSLALVYPNIRLVGITLFEYWAAAGNAFPMALEANREELTIQRSPESEIELISKADARDIPFRTWYLRT